MWRSLTLGAAAVIAVVASGTTSASPATPPGVAGTWIIRADQGDASVASTLELRASGDSVEGVSGPLDTFGIYPLQFRGGRTRTGVHLDVTSKGETVGVLDLMTKGQALTGSGKLFGTPVTIAGARAGGAERAPTVFDFDPSQFHVLTSNAPPPVLHLVSGDTVRTRTVDAYGRDEHEAAAAMAGNPGTGPFYVDGAMPGDTLAIHILKLTPNRDTARMARLLDPRAVSPEYVQKSSPGRTDTWVLDTKTGVARLQAPSERLKDFKAPLRPMLGVVAVAPPASTAIPNTDLGEWGGNLDFPEIREGVTLYLPVYQPGGMLFLGDAHARQSDGEVTGQGLETSMAVEFRVSVVKGKSLGQPWAEDSDYVMVSGIGGSLNDALQQATTGLAQWLKARYQLDDNDVAAVLGSSVEYEIAEVVDPKYHVVAKLKKQTLSQIAPGQKPEAGR